MSSSRDQSFWESKYNEGSTGWDLSEVSTPLKEYIDQLDDLEKKVLVPGSGFGHEVKYLVSKGFENITVVDIAQQPIDKLKSENLNCELICGDFFKHQGAYDLILEQTLFCAIPPSFRDAYVKKCADLLKQGGIMAGVLFNFPLTEQGPPFGGDKEEYLDSFSSYFNIETLEKCTNSEPGREELFIKFIKK